MDFASGSQFPGGPAFSSLTNESQSTEFIRFLEELISSHLRGDPSDRLSKSVWIPATTGLTEYFIFAFPAPGTLRWDLMPEKVKLVGLTMDVLQRVLARVEGLFVDSGDYAIKIFKAMFSLCFRLHVWPEIKEELPTDVPHPSKVKADVLKTMIAWIRALSSGLSTVGKGGEPCWEMLRMVLTSCIELVQELLDLPSNPNFPLHVSLMNAPRIRHADPEGEELTPDFTIQTAHEILPLCSLVFETITSTLSPPLICQGFLVDIGRQILVLGRSVFDFCYSRGNKEYANRAMCLAQIMNTGRLLSTSCLAGSKCSFDYMASTLFWRRMCLGPQDLEGTGCSVLTVVFA
ncbi:hypothetical protein OE88DRAFT_613754 [Heliocybe sulcata]|uniref:Uncharacterized protein n=1 Tax=Heliocybe sulcata TaxID=5364 RepID=A0A5C3NES7_9AGAM|nr:hypothetical protein OE88DRAFT_613754 [Heliocybe sulcata]